jgi:hypothetical protein
MALSEPEWSPEELSRMLEQGEISRDEAARIMGLRADRRAKSEKERMLAAVKSGRIDDIMTPKVKRKPAATRVVNYALALLVALGILLVVFYILLFIVKQRS